MHLIRSVMSRVFTLGGLKHLFILYCNVLLECKMALVTQVPLKLPVHRLADCNMLGFHYGKMPITYECIKHFIVTFHVTLIYFCIEF